MTGIRLFDALFTRRLNVTRPARLKTKSNLIKEIEFNRDSAIVKRCTRRKTESNDNKKKNHKKFPFESEESLMIADKNDESRRRYILHIFTGNTFRFMLSKTHCGVRQIS